MVYLENITPEEAYTLIQKNMNNKKFVILDVRTPEEFASEHIEKAVNLDYYSGNFKNDLDQLNKSSAYLIYCRSGNRSGSTLNIMKDLRIIGTHPILIRYFDLSNIEKGCSNNDKK